MQYSDTFKKSVFSTINTVQTKKDGHSSHSTSKSYLRLIFLELNKALLRLPRSPLQCWVCPQKVKCSKSWVTVTSESKQLKHYLNIQILKDCLLK